MGEVDRSELNMCVFCWDTEFSLPLEWEKKELLRLDKELWGHSRLFSWRIKEGYKPKMTSICLSHKRVTADKLE